MISFLELYKTDRDAFMRTITEDVNWARVASLLDQCASGTRYPGSKEIELVGEMEVPLSITVSEIEASTDTEPARQAADDVINQSRRQEIPK